MSNSRSLRRRPLTRTPRAGPGPRAGLSHPRAAARSALCPGLTPGDGEAEGATSQCPGRGCCSPRGVGDEARQKEGLCPRAATRAAGGACAWGAYGARAAGHPHTGTEGSPRGAGQPPVSELGDVGPRGQTGSGARVSCSHRGGATGQGHPRAHGRPGRMATALARERGADVGSAQVLEQNHGGDIWLARRGRGAGGEGGGRQPVSGPWPSLRFR